MDRVTNNVDPTQIVKRFIIPLNEAEGENGTVTNHIIGVTTQSRRANKRALCHYLKDYHGIPAWQHKTILKALGFWGFALGTKK
jgi:hypothetical protein